MRRARLLQEAHLLCQHAVQIIKTVKDPQGLRPGADLNRGRAMLHRPQGAGTAPKALREDGHGVVPAKSQCLQACAKFYQVLLLVFNVQHFEG